MPNVEHSFVLYALLLEPGGCLRAHIPLFELVEPEKKKVSPQLCSKCRLSVRPRIQSPATVLSSPFKPPPELQLQNPARELVPPRVEARAFRTSWQFMALGLSLNLEYCIVKHAVFTPSLEPRLSGLQKLRNANGTRLANIRILGPMLSLWLSGNVAVRCGT